jgi:peroxiredoxin
MSMKPSLYLAAAAVVLAIGTGAYVVTSVEAAPTPAPAATYVLLDGSKKTTADLKGRVTLVNFWATSCSICVAEMPKVIATHQKYHAAGFDTLAVAMRYDPPSSVVHYTQTRQLPFDIAIDNTGSIAQAWGKVEATPTTFLVNKQGEIVRRFQGEPDFAKLHELIEKLLKQT